MNNKYGFTLIELLTVVVIIGILTSIALPQYRRSIQRAEAADALINLKTIFDSAKRHYAMSSVWPTGFDGLDVELLDVTSDGKMGEFQYSFAAASTLCLTSGACSVKACRLRGNSSADTYCLQAYYSLSGTRDVFTCKDAASGKYQGLCDSLCATTGEECVIE